MQKTNTKSKVLIASAVADLMRKILEKCLIPAYQNPLRVEATISVSPSRLESIVNKWSDVHGIDIGDQLDDWSAQLANEPKGTVTSEAGSDELVAELGGRIAAVLVVLEKGLKGD